MSGKIHLHLTHDSSGLFRSTENAVNMFLSNPTEIESMVGPAPPKKPTQPLKSIDNASASGIRLSCGTEEFLYHNHELNLFILLLYFIRIYVT